MMPWGHGRGLLRKVDACIFLRMWDACVLQVLKVSWPMQKLVEPSTGQSMLSPGESKIASRLFFSYCSGAWWHLSTTGEKQPRWMNLFNIFTSQKSKPPIQITTLKKRTRFYRTFSRFSSNQIHAGVMLASCIFTSMPDSCQIHAGFSWYLGLAFIHIALCRFHAGFMHICIYADFMSDSCRIQLNSVL